MSQATATHSTQAGASPHVWRLGLSLAVFAVLWVDLVRQLSYTWDTNEQYAYGWFVPFQALALFWRRWLIRPAPQSITPPYWLIAFMVFLLLGLLPVRVVHEINPDWPLVNWVHCLLVVGFSLYAVFLAGGWRWLRYFAFPICFILVAVQWPNRIERGLTQNLMQVVATLTVEIIGWFDIPAMQRGNLIELSTGVLGVDEACSGIRSFQSTLMAALFLSELYLLRTPIRLLLVGAGLTAAFLLNVCRTLILTWQANANGLSAIDKWHDPAGFTIAVASFAVLWLLAVLIKRKSSAADAALAHENSVLGIARGQGNRGANGMSLGSGEGQGVMAAMEVSQSSAAPPSTLNRQALTPHRYLLAVGCWSLVCFVATEVWYRAHEVKNSGVFHWSAAPPENKPGFQKIELPPRSLKLLTFDLGATGRWPEEDGSEWTVYFFRWNPTSANAIFRARQHRPDVCLPASGLRMVEDGGVVLFTVGHLKFPFHCYVYESEGRTLHVFFCQWEDGERKQTGLAGSEQSGRVITALKGRRHLGQQNLEFIISGYRSLDEASTALASTLPGLIQMEAPAGPNKTVQK